MATLSQNINEAIKLVNGFRTVVEGTATQITIPNGATAISKGVFTGKTSLINIEIPDSVTNIGEQAFKDCTNLEKAIIPNSVTTIGATAYGGCINLEEIVIGNGVTAIPDYCFAYISFANGCDIYLSSNITAIGSYAFGDMLNYGNVDIYYEGSQSDWNNINIGSYNSLFNSPNTTFHYNYTPT